MPSSPCCTAEGLQVVQLGRRPAGDLGDQVVPQERPRRAVHPLGEPLPPPVHLPGDRQPAAVEAADALHLPPPLHGHVVGHRPADERRELLARPPQPVEPPQPLLCRARTPVGLPFRRIRITPWCRGRGRDHGGWGQVGAEPAGGRLAADRRHEQDGCDDGDDDECRQWPLAIGPHNVPPSRPGYGARQVSRSRKPVRRAGTRNDPEIVTTD